MSKHLFPTIRCPLCQDWEICRASIKQDLVDTQLCYRYRREIHLGRVQEHFQFLRERAELPKYPFWDMEDRLLDHLSDAQKKFSFLLEFSYSSLFGQPSCYRFSYAFPEFGMGRVAEEMRAMIEMLQPFGQAPLAILKQLLALAQPGELSQLLLGIDATHDATRFKLYYQFEPGIPRPKFTLLLKLLPSGLPKHVIESLNRLHLVGVDFGEGGIQRVKLYFMHDHLSASQVRDRFQDSIVLMNLLSNGNLEGLKDFLTIQRIERSKWGDIKQVHEVDFGLIPNEITAEAVAAAAQDAGFSNTLLELQALTEGHHMAVNRVSVQPYASSKVNLYYLILDAATH